MANAFAARGWLAVLVAAQLTVGLSSARADDKPKAPDPADATVPVPVTTYDSALGDFRRMDLKQVPWKRANETVRSVGGHMGSVGEGEATGDAPAHAGHKPK